MNSTTLYAADRRKLAAALSDSLVCGGNRKVSKVAQGLVEITDVLTENGYSLDMVTGDLLIGDKGNRTLTFRKANDTEDAFFEYPTIENSRIALSWENLANEGDDPSIEIIAYVS